MSIQDLRNFVRRRPFVPFRIYVSDGSHFDVRHPESIALAARSVALGVGGSVSNGDVADHFTIVDLIHITRLEPLDQPAAQA